MGHLEKCRVCFTAVARDDEAYNLLQLPMLAVKFSDCTNLVVDPADVEIISSEICCHCYEQLEMYHAFRSLCITADRKWRVKRRVGRKKPIREDSAFFEEDEAEEDQEEEDQEEEDQEEEHQEMEEDPGQEMERLEMEAELNMLEEQEMEEEQEIEEEQEKPEEHEKQGDQMEQEESNEDQEDEELPSLQAPELVLCDGNLNLQESKPQVQRKSSPKKSHKKANEKETAVNSESNAVYICDICSEGFQDYKRLVNHKNNHDGHNLYQCSEPGCEESFNRYEQCKQHELQHAADGTRFICGEEGCHKMYRHKASLKHHQSKAHGLGEPPKTHICEFCGRVFKNVAALTHHRYTHSDQMELPFACEMPDCSLKFITEEKLRVHMMRHQGIKNFSCPYCGLRKTTKNELRLHINFHTLERSWKCQFCPKVCNSSTALKKHVNTIHEKKRDYACRYCEKSFANSNTRKYHEMIHTGEKNFECQECGKKFIQPAALRTHRLIHERKTVKEGEAATYGSEPLVASMPQIEVATPVIVAQLQPAYTILQVTSLGYPTL